MSTIRSPLRVLLLTCVLLAVPTAPRADRMTKQQYIQYVPLHHPRAVRQTEASAAFHLYGDPAAPDYRDAEPVDGIDDRRHATLEQLALRFSPLLVMNSYAMPMDFQRFGDGRDAWPLSVDVWNVAAVGNQLYSEESINLVALVIRALRRRRHRRRLPPAGAPARVPSRHPVLGAVPGRRRCLRARTSSRSSTTSFPAKTASPGGRSTRIPTRGQIRSGFHDFLRTYVHPFVHEVPAAGARPVGYELVLQYWLFYPFNDGGNNHVGDWEHVNVVVSPRRLVERPLTAEELTALLTGAFDDELVIRRVDYYFHENVYPLDFSSPNVYLPREAWQQQAAALVTERAGAEWFWEKTREMAYCDDAEQVVNTHPVGYIGGDDKGTDQLLAPPGGANRDSHGTYPFPGVYRKVGPAGAAEEVTSTFDHRAYYAASPEERAEKFGAQAGRRRGVRGAAARADRAGHRAGGDRWS